MATAGLRDLLKRINMDEAKLLKDLRAKRAERDSVAKQILKAEKHDLKQLGKVEMKKVEINKVEEKCRGRPADVSKMINGCNYCWGLGAHVYGGHRHYKACSLYSVKGGLSSVL